VNVSDPARVGFIIDTAVENGANRISNIQFKVDRAVAYYQQALSLALHNAQAEAINIAETMHLPLQLLPTEIVDEQVNTPIHYRSMAVSSDMTPIEQ
ncbi:SIMPL domain-containing protein, partial [Lysinibacillus sp. D4B1_S16]|uniref:SIMPL domain-containing protein n=1 Tax=Lysinibacillus sp. D4B1_S16 TaxID=2941231 RepID=UPI0020BF383A